MAAVTDLEAGLQAMLNLKPPGVSGSRITSLTTLCVSNVQSESVLIQKMYTHFKKTPGTHKLGVLYVVDSVTRKWLEKAKAQGQPVSASAQDGTFAAGVNRVTELMPVLMNDITQSIPEDQKDKLRKLIDIWEKGQTFPLSMLQSFREKLTAEAQSTTPPGSPPSNAMSSHHHTPAAPNSSVAPPAAAPPSDGSAILAALANMARQSSNSSAAPSTSVPAAAAHSIPVSAPPPVAAVPLPHLQQPMYPAAPNALAVHFPNAQGYGQTKPSVPPHQYPPAPAAPVLAGSVDSNTQQQILLIKALADQGVPFDKIPAIIQSIGNGAVPSSVPGAPIPAPASTYPPAPQPWQSAGGGPRGEHGYSDYSAPDRNNRRSRSRSPDQGYGGRGRDDGRGSPLRDRGAKRGNDYRQRSPPGRRGNSPSSEFPPVERWIEFDSSLPPGTIRVLSRTLFVGGVTCSEPELRDIFGRFGIVQTCIVNKDKRHAFVKMLTRRDSENAKAGMENARDINIPLRTRWGVGFGPRDCSDYATGVSVIPINKLTEADRKWMLTAPYGGTGGRPIEAGMCVEEPDIEIGAGVSSKAMSRRMQTDKGGSQGPKSTRNREDEWRGNHENESGRRRGGRPGGGGNNNQSRGSKQDGAAFPFGIGTLPNGMPSFPPGFSFPDPGASN